MGGGVTPGLMGVSIHAGSTAVDATVQVSVDSARESSDEQLASV